MVHKLWTIIIFLMIFIPQHLNCYSLMTVLQKVTLKLDLWISVMYQDYRFLNTGHFTISFLVGIFLRSDDPI